MTVISLEGGFLGGYSLQKNDLFVQPPLPAHFLVCSFEKLKHRPNIKSNVFRDLSTEPLTMKRNQRQGYLILSRYLLRILEKTANPMSLESTFSSIGKVNDCQSREHVLFQ